MSPEARKKKHARDPVYASSHSESRRRAKILWGAIVVFIAMSALALGWIGMPVLVARVPPKVDVIYGSAQEAQTALRIAVDQVKDITVSDSIRSAKLQEVSAICEKFPVLRAQAEMAVFKAVLIGGSIKIRSEALKTLATFKTPRAFALVEQLLRSKEPALVMAAVQGLENFIGSNRDPAARTLLFKAAKADWGAPSTVATQILVKHRDRRIAVEKKPEEEGAHP